jgi:hypothetical protein
MYGAVDPSVTGGDVVNVGDQVGTLNFRADGSRLQLAIRIGEDITSAYPMQRLVGGEIPPADAFGLTDGWIDPIDFFVAHPPDNNWPEP